MAYNNYYPCDYCHVNTRYSYKGTWLPVCSKCYPEWRKTVPCDWCGIPCLDNPVETEDEAETIYFWHYNCWLKACGTTSTQHTFMAPSNRIPKEDNRKHTKALQRDSRHVSTP